MHPFQQPYPPLWYASGNRDTVPWIAQHGFNTAHIFQPALEMYRKRHGRITPDQVADFLLLDRQFPRAIHACLIKAEESLHALSGASLGTFQNAAEQHLGRLRAELDYAQIQDIMAGGLHAFLNTFQARLNHVGAAIFDTFFAVPPVPAPAA
jgi:uncharacterized alpha-E superfamily protein